MTRSRLTDQQRNSVIRRAYSCCEYCWSQEKHSPDPFSVEHVIPVSKGGTNDEDNMAYACQGCNGRKYTSTTAIDPITGDIASLYHPRRHQWSDHLLAWQTGYPARSPIGHRLNEYSELLLAIASQHVLLGFYLVDRRRPRSLSSFG